MNRDQINKYIEDQGIDEVLLADGYDEAFMGLAFRQGKTVACYHREKCISILEKDMTREEAEDYFEFNTQGAWVGEGTPVYISCPTEVMVEWQ